MSTFLLGLLVDAAAAAAVAVLNEVAITSLICVGLYQAACNIFRVFTFELKNLPLKVQHVHLHSHQTVALVVSSVGVSCVIT